MGAQAPSAATFDVASIRPAAALTADAVRSGQFRAGTTIGKDNAEFNFVTLMELLPYAYDVKPFQVAGPSILKEARWNVQARFDESAADQVPAMMRALLEERFKLAMHIEKRDMPVYELVVAKGGPKMEVVEAVAAPPAATTPALPGLAGALGGRGKGGFPPEGGFRPEGGRGKGQDFKGKGKGGFGGGRGPLGGALGESVTMEPSPETCSIKLSFAKVTMASMAETLAPFLDRPVLDSTGLKGSYKAAMSLPQDAMRLMMQNQVRNSGLEELALGRGGPGGPGGRGGRGGGGDGKGKGRGPGGCEDGGALAAGGDTNSSAAIFQAVQQLGLRLQAKKAPFDTIVVDRVEKQPTEN